MIFDNQLEQQRLEKISELRDMGINPYPHYISVDMSIEAFRNKFSYISEDKKADEEVRLSGRLKLKRVAGKSTFANIEDDSASIQIYFSKDSVGEDAYVMAKKYLEVGDIILVKGYAFITKTGEFSLHASEISLASKGISPLPEKYHGLVDKELRYRQRYLDMIMNSEIKEDFKKRSLIVSEIRKFFETYGFLEVETPMLQQIAGGANAKSFVTHHNALDIDNYLRVAPELYLKRLVVGGMGAVFEINRCFRNEGMDLTHNPEFTTIEFYWPYHTYHDLMRLTEELFLKLLDKLGLGKKIIYDEQEIDFSTPFAKVSYLDAIVGIGGVSRDIVEDADAIIAKLKADGFEVNENLSLGHLQSELFDAYVEDKLVDPMFITDFPISISPLSRRSDNNPNIAERFELYVAGKEIANGFNELNDPLDQYERFLAQIEAKKAGDDEAAEMDEDFCRALGYGMPPTAGEGIGIDRLVMLLTGKKSIRDVILFPAMKPVKNLGDDK